MVKPAFRRTQSRQFRGLILRQVVLLLLAWICFAAAVLSLPLPVPLGFMFFVVGVSLLLAASPMMRRWLRLLRIRYPGLDSRIEAVSLRLPAFVQRALNDSSPSGKDVA
jgi:hypothetical protein